MVEGGEIFSGEGNAITVRKGGETEKALASLGQLLLREAPKTWEDFTPFET